VPAAHLDGSVFFRNPWAKRFGDILDGTSVQFMIGERSWEIFSANGQRRHCNAACVFGQVNHNGNNDRGMADAHGCMQYAINHRGNNNRCRRAFTSQHPGGAQFVLADGSVRFIDENIEWNNNNAVNTLAEKLCAINDGQSVGQF
jgi:prepilin-type processing-associated H-X9-DG protein